MRGKTLERLVAEAVVENSEPVVILDISDKELYQAGDLPGAILLPRAAIELNIDEVVPDQDARTVTYCGGNTRGSLSAHTLKIMGYENVSERVNLRCYATSRSRVVQIDR